MFLAVFERHASSEKQILREIWGIHEVISHMQVTANTIHEEGKFSIFEESQSQLTLMIRRLMALAEKYPEVGTSRDFKTTQAHLDGLENRVATGERFYNQAAKEFNKTADVFPTSLIAKIMRYGKKSYFKKELDAQQFVKS